QKLDAGGAPGAVDEFRAGIADDGDVGAGGSCGAGRVAPEDRGNDSIMLVPRFGKAPRNAKLRPPEWRQPAARRTDQLVDVGIVGPVIESRMELDIVRGVFLFRAQMH